MNPFEICDPRHPIGVGIRLELERYIEGSDLAELVRRLLADQLSPILIEHIAAHLERKAKKRPGRPSLSARHQPDPKTWAEAEARLQSGGIVEARVFASLLRPDLVDKLAGPVVDHIAAHLERRARRKPGRKPSFIAPFLADMAESNYYTALAWFQLPVEQRGPWEFECSSAQHPDEPPHVQALETVRARFYRYRCVSWKRLANIFSELETKRLSPPTSDWLREIIERHTRDARERARRRAAAVAHPSGTSASGGQLDTA